MRRKPPPPKPPEEAEIAVAKAIHRRCIQCLGSKEEVMICRAYTCGLYNFRNGPEEEEAKNND